jgi:hypothetical protein
MLVKHAADSERAAQVSQIIQTIGAPHSHV